MAEPQSVALDRVRSAEELRQNKRYLDAYAQFNEVLSDHKDWKQLAPERLKWAQAHAGAAIAAAYTPFSDLEDYLETAEDLLRTALGMGTSKSGPSLITPPENAVHHPWAWARLGEVFRHKGNLPSFYFDTNRVLWARDGADDYNRGVTCFKLARDQYKSRGVGSRQPGAYGWAHAHYGALLLNRRRYYNDEQAREAADEALKHLKDATKNQNYNNPWTLAYLGAAHFLLALDKLRNPPAPGSPDANMEFLLSAHYIMLTWHLAPMLEMHSVQPGSIERDPTFAILYDLVDLLPQLGTAQLQILAHINEWLVPAAVALPMRNPQLLRYQGAHIRQLYLRMYLKFLEVALRQKNPGVLLDSTQDDPSHRLRRLAFELHGRAENLISKDPALLSKAPARPCDTSNRFLIDYFNTMRNILQAYVMARSQQDLSGLADDLITTLRAYEEQLLPGVLKGGASNAAQTFWETYSNADDDTKRQLLTPIWSLGKPSFDRALRKIFVISDDETFHATGDNT